MAKKTTFAAALLFVAPLIAAAGADYRTEEIDLGGTPLLLRIPDEPAPGRPWLWVAEFPGHQQAAEDTLLSKGWHVAHVRVADEFGSPLAMEKWSAAYEELQGKRSLNAKPVIWAISRGGLYALSWLRRYPDRASALVLDNAVADIRSWPAGLPLSKKGSGDAVEWERYKERFGYKNDTEALSASPHPTDGLKNAVKKGVVLISGHGTADELVPYEDNGKILVELWRENGGTVHTFPNEGGGHFPHGVAEVGPVIELLAGEKTPR